MYCTYKVFNIQHEMNDLGYLCPLQKTFVPIKTTISPAHTLQDLQHKLYSSRNNTKSRMTCTSVPNWVALKQTSSKTQIHLYAVSRRSEVTSSDFVPKKPVVLQPTPLTNFSPKPDFSAVSNTVSTPSSTLSSSEGSSLPPPSNIPLYSSSASKNANENEILLCSFYNFNPFWQFARFYTYIYLN